MPVRTRRSLIPGDQTGTSEMRLGIWASAAAVAARTPESRNRYVDFLRALSIIAVISGHWLIAAPFLDEGELSLTNMLARQPWTQLLTWVFQVMPVFFLVGGYSNGVSWQAAMRDGRRYADWLDGRLQRLVGPVLPLVAGWAVLGFIAHRFGTSVELVKVASQMALIPIWFLAVYVGAVVLVPVSYGAWRRFGMASFWSLAGLVVLDDVLFFGADLRVVGWLNYGFIWLAVHQLGYAWRDGQFAGVKQTLLWALCGFTALVVLVTVGPYPVSMVSVPGQDVSNTLPPKLPMLLMGITQCGLLLSLETPLRRWLARCAPWTAVVLVNGMIMTIFLWHLTASTLTVGMSLALGGVGLTIEPGSGLWWALRPLWLGVYCVALVFLALLLSGFERGGRGGRPAAAWRQVAGATLVCGGLALLALDGVGAEGWLGLRVWVVVLPLVGAALAGIAVGGWRVASGD